MHTVHVHHSLYVCVQEKVSKLKAIEAKQDEDKKQLRLNLDDAENRVTKGELARRALEGDLQRMKLAMNDKETENQVLQERTEALGRQITDLDTKGQSLQLTIDRLSSSLAKSEEEEHAHKDKVRALRNTHYSLFTKVFIDQPRFIFINVQCAK